VATAVASSSEGGRDAVQEALTRTFVAHRGKLGVWDVAWVGTKP
jgi:hypothetical protein